jgi:hypothetical protein
MEAAAQGDTSPRHPIMRSIADGFAPSLRERVGAFEVALQAHRQTVDVPRPVEAPLVEAIVSAGGWGAVQIIEDPAPIPATPVIGRPLPSHVFRSMFTLDERKAMTVAAATALAAGDATMRVFLDDLAAAPTVDLDAPEVAAALAEFVAAGALADARAAEVTAR